MRDLQGRVAIVTGCTSGIGEECAAELAGRGATVVLAARSSEKAAATLAKIKERCPRADIVTGPLLDLANPDSIRLFAAEYRRSGRALHILVHNAGALTFSTRHNEHGIAELCQANHLGAYLLTRLLEGVLLHSAPSRVVVVSSATHRYGVIGHPWRDFLKGLQGHYYANTKLANVLFAYELQRRLGPLGVQACAADPGTVRTSIWRNRPLVHRLTNLLWAPPAVGARPLVFAATAAWDEPCALPRGISKQTTQSQRRLEAAGAANGGGAAPSSNGSRDELPNGRPRGAPTDSTGNGKGSSCLPPPERDFRYFAPRLYGSRALLWYTPEVNRGWLGEKLLWFNVRANSLGGAAKQAAWAGIFAAVTLLDSVARLLPGGTRLLDVAAVPSAPASYDAQLAAALWDASADAVGVPREVQGPTGVIN